MSGNRETTCRRSLQYGQWSASAIRCVLPSASCRPTMSARAAVIASTTLAKSTTSPPSQMLNVMTRTSTGVGAGVGTAGA